MAIALFVLQRLDLLFFARPMISDVGMYRGPAVKAVKYKTRHIRKSL